MASQVLDATQIEFLTRFLGLNMPPADGDDAARRGMIEGYLSTLPGDIDGLSQQDPDLADRLRGDLAAARRALDAGDLTTAFDGLEASAQALAQAQGAARAQEAGEAIPEGLVKARVREIELALSEWQIGRMQAIDELSDLVAELMQEDDPDLVEIGGRIAALGRDIPNALHDALKDVRGAVRADDATRIASAKVDAVKAVLDAARYLKDNADDLRKCEDNPYGLSVDAMGTVAAAIRAVDNSLKRI